MKNTDTSNNMNGSLDSVDMNSITDEELKALQEYKKKKDMESKVLGLCRRAYSSSTSYVDSNIRKEWETGYDLFKGNHVGESNYQNKDYKQFRSTVFRPKTRSAIRKSEAALSSALFSTQEIVRCLPVDDSSDKQRASADLMTELLNYRLTKTIPFFVISNAAYQDSQVVGTVISRQYWDFEKNTPAIELIPIENFRFDPACNWVDPIGSSPYLIRMMPVYVCDLKKQMEKGGIWRKVADKYFMTNVTEEFDTTRQNREGERQDRQTSVNQTISDYDQVWVHENIFKVDGVDKIFYTIGTEVLLSDVVDLKEVYAHNRRPYVMGISVIEAHRIYPTSVASLTKDIQKEINDLANLRMDNVRFALNKRYFARRGANVDLGSLRRNIPGAITLMDDPNTDVKESSVADVTSSSYREQDLLNLDFDDLAGSFSGSSVQANRNLNETVGGMQLLNQGASQVSEYQLKTFTETWLEPVLNQLVLLEQHLESDEVVLALAGNNAKLYQEFGIDRITNELLDQQLTLTVNIGMGAVSPATRIERFMMGITTMTKTFPTAVDKLDFNEVSKEVFGQLGYKDGARFFKKEEEVDPKIKELEAMVQDLQMKLQMKKPQELIDAEVEYKKALAEKTINDIDVNRSKMTKTNVEAAFGAMQAANVIVMNPRVAPIADTIMEAAGYVNPNKGNMNFPELGSGLDFNMPVLGGNIPQSLAMPQVRPNEIGGMSVNLNTNMSKNSANNDMPTNTNPMTPAKPQAPMSALKGVNQGIETTRPTDNDFGNALNNGE